MFSRVVAIFLLNLGLATAPLASTWESIGPDGGRVDGLEQSITNPDRMVALLYTQGVHRSDDRGESWTRVDQGLPQGQRYVAVAISSGNADVMLLAPASGDAIHRSTDGGMSWAPIFVVAGLGEVRDIEFDPFDANNVLLTVREGAVPGIHRSTDGGTSWASSNSGFSSTTPWQIEYHPTTPGVSLVAADEGSVFRSTNGGTNWTPSNMNGHNTIGAVSYCRNSPGTVWSADRTPNRVLRSTDGGITFANLGNVPCIDGECTMTNLAVHPSSAATILGGLKPFYCNPDCYSGAEIRGSTNSGTTWGASYIPNQWIYGDQNISSLFFDTALSDWAFCTIGNGFGYEYSVGLARTTDAGQTWNPSMNGLKGLSISTVRTDGTGRVYALGSKSNDMFRSNDSGDSWIRTGGFSGSPYEVLAFEVQKGVPGILHEAGGWWEWDYFVPVFHRSTDFGASWIASALPFVGMFLVPDCVASDPVTGETIYLWCSFGPGDLFRSTNGGQSFDVLEEVTPAEAAVVSPIDPARIYAARGFFPAWHVEYSTDSGVTWSNWGSGLPTDLPIALFLDPPDPFLPQRDSAQGSLVVVLRTLGAYRSTGPGAAWTAIDLPGYQGQPVIDCDYDSGSDRLFLCTEGGGVYVSGEGFVTQGLTAGTPRTVAFDPVSGSLLTGTDHASVFRLDLEDVVDAGEISAPPPRSCSIAASPIPSRGIVKFSVTLVREAARVQVSIVDVRGRRVANVFDGALSRGTHALSWNPRSEGRMAAGVYFAKLEALEDVASARIVLMNE